MAPQFFKKLALVAALMSLGLGADALAQSTAQTSPSGSAAGSKTTTGAASGSASSGNMSGAGKSSLASSERKFIEEAAVGGMAEVEMGKIAQQKGQNQQVKDFGQRMAQDHGKANEELKSLASSKGMQLPADTDKKHKKHADELQKKSADKFDHEYAEMMVKDHKKDVKEFEKQAKNAKDADVRAFAAKTLPTLQEHLKMAQAMQDSIKTAPKKSAKNTASSASGSSMSGSSSSGMSGSSSGNTGGTGSASSMGSSAGSSGSASSKGGTTK